MKKRLIALVGAAMLTFAPVTAFAAESPVAKPIEKSAEVTVSPATGEKDFVKICLCAGAMDIVAIGTAFFFLKKEK